MLKANILQLETGGVTILDSASNFNTAVSSVGYRGSADRLVQVAPKAEPTFQLVSCSKESHDRTAQQL
jgi:hypothetical protein